MTLGKIMVAGLAALAVGSLGTGAALAAAGTATTPTDAPLRHTASIKSVGPSHRPAAPLDSETMGPDTLEASDATETAIEASHPSAASPDSGEANAGDTSSPSAHVSAHSDDQGVSEGGDDQNGHGSAAMSNATWGPPDTQTDSQDTGSGNNE